MRGRASVAGPLSPRPRSLERIGRQGPASTSSSAAVVPAKSLVCHATEWVAVRDRREGRDRCPYWAVRSSPRPSSTERHVANVERAIQALGEEPDESPCPAIEGLEKEGQSNLKAVDDSFNDHVSVAGVCETEHHEIAVYEGLITKAEAMGEQDIVALLQENLEQEEASSWPSRPLRRTN